MTTMTKDEMMKKIEELEAKLARGNETMKTRVLSLIESGINSIEAIGQELSITSKNVSSNLTHIRKELEAGGRTIVSHRIGTETKLAIVELSIFG